jgi:hypothetical protein
MATSQTIEKATDGATADTAKRDAAHDRDSAAAPTCSDPCVAHSAGGRAAGWFKSSRPD